MRADPRRPELLKVIEAEEIERKTGYSRPHTIHCGPDGIPETALAICLTVDGVSGPRSETTH